VIIWRRHVAPCESTDHSDPKCGCPIYQEYRVGKKRFRRSLKTRNWQKALAEARQKELEGFKQKTKSPTIEQACDAYLADAKARELREPTLYKFRLLFRQLQDFAKDKGLVFVSDFNLDNLRQFRASWPNKNESARVKLGNLKSFFRFCHDAKWIQDNPTQPLKAGRVVETSIVPITSDEFERILKACDEHKKLRAIVLLMYYSGLAIRDAVTLRQDAIKHGKLFLRRTKTGTDVLCPLPGEVLVALRQIGSSEYFFWSGKSKPKSAVGDYQRALQKVFEDAKAERVFPHLFRHTCITNWLSAGVPVETVAVLVGHSSTRVTMKHYSHWIKSRQDNLEAEVKKSWAQLGTVDTQSAGNR
jgi:integrase/recombinase XerD